MTNHQKTNQLHYYFLQLVFLTLITYNNATKNSNQSCGTRTLPYPFGLSQNSPIRLNCTPQNDIVLGTFLVHSVTSDSILIALKANCSRPINSIRDLFSNNFAPTSRDGLLLQDCSSVSSLSSCLIPNTLVQTRFEEQDCGKKSNISCYTEGRRDNWIISYKEVMRTRCRSLFSSITIGPSVNDTTVVSLEVQMLELRWWLQGECQCVKNSNCTRVVLPVDGRLGYRCQCVDGFQGDGYRLGRGCRKDSSGCNPSKYIAGHCGGATKVGILIGVVAGAAMMVSVGFLCCVIRRSFSLKSTKQSKQQLYEETGICIPIYPYKVIEKATDNFSNANRLGTGAYGTVYSGKLYNDDLVAIKRIKHYDGSIERVINEIKLLSSVEHPNLVRLFGCSIEEGEQILVYEFMPNGTLCQHLQKERGGGLYWPIRLRIAVETAQAIAHLHSSIDHPPIYHRDIKSSNILLHYNFKSKVADFGLSRLGLPGSSHISTAPQGTPGYLDPQYHQDFHLSDKSDVYSFGVVLVEMITGLKVVDFSRPQNEINLATLAVDRIGSGHLVDIIDPVLRQDLDACTLSTIHKMGELAFRCLAFHSDMRPSMSEVANELVQISLCGI